MNEKHIEKRFNRLYTQLDQVKKTQELLRSTLHVALFLIVFVAILALM